MKHRNICKFIESDNENYFRTKCFVCERTPEAMRRNVTVNQKRTILISESCGTFFLNGEAVRVNKGDIVFIMNGDTFYCEPDEGMEYLYIDYDGYRSEELFKRFAIIGKNRLCGGHEGLIPFWRDAITRATDMNIDLVSESVLLYSFSDLTDNVPQTDTAAVRAAQIIDEEFGDADISLGTVSEMLGYNEKYLSHSFKRDMGISFSEYLRNVRIRHAVFLIEHGIDSVKNVAFLCGFDDPLYFSTVFKKVIGISPAVYMKREKDNNKRESSVDC